MIKTYINGPDRNGYQVNMEETFDGWYISVRNTKTNRIDASADMYYIDFDTAKAVWEIYAKKFYDIKTSGGVDA